MNRSSRLKNIMNRRADLWDESETDTDTSSTSNIDHMKLSTRTKSSNTSDTSSDENSESSVTRTCCLICSILPNLSNVNTCPRHLASVTTPITPTQVVYMIPPPSMNNCSTSHCHCRAKSKRHRRSSSSSSSSSSTSSSSTRTRHYRKKRSMTVLSSDSSSQDELFFSPNVQSQEPTTDSQQPRTDYTQARLSPSLPPSTTISTNTNNSLQKYQQLLLTSFLQRTNQRNNDQIEAMLQDTQNKSFTEESSPDVIEITSESFFPSSLSNHRIVHVKDDDEVLNDTERKNLSINMSQVTDEMRNHEYPQPIILLKRVCLDQYEPLCD